MKNLTIISVCFLLCPFSFGVVAEEELELNASVWGHDPAWLVLKNAEMFDVHLDDQVGDGCWTDLSGAKNAVELQLIRSGYETQDGNDGSAFIPDVVISALGYEIPSTGGCAIAMEFEATVPDVGEYTVGESVLSSLYTKSVISYQSVLTSRKSESNAMIKSQFESMAQQFLVDIERAKQGIRGALETQDESAATEFWIELLK
ncbi:hypothetical protein [Marinobacter sp. HL-58]|uniref:hypothetical protein n=1 Tax=Marinobacter sp. HL-58 TaxID=1479237 RepID=UPI0006D96691|nr:hypothetical protein [Marinobacter sp. HL-58]KPP99227.1 MAG: hypothetical protein HLUCCO03_05570 [Marinobacter sp. HL-58]